MEVGELQAFGRAFRSGRVDLLEVEEWIFWKWKRGRSTNIIISSYYYLHFKMINLELPSTLCNSEYKYESDYKYG